MPPKGRVIQVSPTFHAVITASPKNYTHSKEFFVCTRGARRASWLFVTADEMEASFVAKALDEKYPLMGFGVFMMRPGHIGMLREGADGDTVFSMELDHFETDRFFQRDLDYAPLQPLEADDYPDVQAAVPELRKKFFDLNGPKADDGEDNPYSRYRFMLGETFSA